MTEGPPDIVAESRLREWQNLANEGLITPEEHERLRSRHTRLTNEPPPGTPEELDTSGDGPAESPSGPEDAMTKDPPDAAGAPDPPGANGEASSGAPRAGWRRRGRGVGCVITGHHRRCRGPRRLRGAAGQRRGAGPRRRRVRVCGTRRRRRARRVAASHERRPGGHRARDGRRGPGPQPPGRLDRGRPQRLDLHAGAVDVAQAALSCLRLQGISRAAILRLLGGSGRRVAGDRWNADECRWAGRFHSLRVGRRECVPRLVARARRAAQGASRARLRCRPRARRDRGLGAARR